MSPTDPSSFADGPVQAPTLLAGRYRLERRIGQGGMAEVWVALDEQLDRFTSEPFSHNRIGGEIRL